MHDRILTIDVGNSRTKFGLFDRPTSTDRLPACLSACTVDRDDVIPWPEIRSWSTAPVTSIIAGANPEGVRHVHEGWPHALGPAPRHICDCGCFPLTIDLPEPDKAGIDRLLNAVAANTIRPADAPAIIVDSGTATTIDFVDEDGAFAGGAILPGFELSARALNHYTALLPLISIEELAQTPRTSRGTSTLEALHSGLFWGQLGAVKELVDQLTPAGASPLVLLTGGGSHLLAPSLPDARYEPALALQGLALVAESCVGPCDE